MKLTLLALFALATSFAFGKTTQQPAPAPSCAAPAIATIDVASVKPSQINPHSSHIHGTADSITSSGSLLSMIEYAYDLHDFQLVGGPDWVRTATWDIVAKVDQPPADWSSLSGDAQGAIERQRMAAVLALRFALKCHFETKELPVYNLVVSKSGSKLKQTPADAADKGSIDAEGKGRQHHVEVRGVELSYIAKLLSSDVGRTVIDKTGLTGLYDFTLTYTSDPDAGSPVTADDSASGPTIFTALEEQLGLRLESAKGPVPVLIIDSISRPSEN